MKTYDNSPMIRFQQANRILVYDNNLNRKIVVFALLKNRLFRYYSFVVEILDAPSFKGCQELR